MRNRTQQSRPQSLIPVSVELTGCGDDLHRFGCDHGTRQRCHGTNRSWHSTIRLAHIGRTSVRTSRQTKQNIIYKFELFCWVRYYHFKATNSHCGPCCCCHDTGVPAIRLPTRPPPPPPPSSALNVPLTLGKQPLPTSSRWKCEIILKKIFENFHHSPDA